ncbi:MAG: serine hydrolase, partial [Nitrospirae bacterium]|nr:serine hydrolase [Nitrospirota bacterium]
MVSAFVERDRFAGDWGLGWMFPSTPSSAGQYFSRKSFGHLGFTGTSVWFDPLADLGVIFLSNRVHPTRENNALKEFRPLLHDTVYREAIDDQT